MIILEARKVLQAILLLAHREIVAAMVAAK